MSSIWSVKFLSELSAIELSQEVLLPKLAVAKGLKILWLGVAERSGRLATTQPLIFISWEFQFRILKIFGVPP